MNVLTQNIDEIKIDQISWKCWENFLSINIRSKNKHFLVVLLKKLIYTGDILGNIVETKINKKNHRNIGTNFCGPSFFTCIPT